LHYLRIKLLLQTIFIPKIDSRITPHNEYL